MKTLGIVAHSAEGGALCFLTACHAGAVQLGAHLHPPIVLSAVPMGLSLPGWEALQPNHGALLRANRSRQHALHHPRNGGWQVV